MQFLTWNDRFSVGVQKMDSQHKKLMDLINMLHTAISGGRGAEVVGTVLSELTDYTKYHFKAEEELLRVGGYAARMEHQVKHRDLIMRLEDFKLREELGSDESVKQLVSFLKYWLITHILRDDMEYRSLFVDEEVLTSETGVLP